MWRFMFFFMGVPMMIMSFFEAVDVLPYVQSVDLTVNGNEIVLTEEETLKLQEQVFQLFEDSRTMPAFGVCFDEMHKEEVKNGIFVSLKFGGIYQVNELPFDELVFKVEPDFQGFNLCRGMRGIFQGRCIYIDLDGNMQNLSDFINSLPQVQAVLSHTEEVSEVLKQEKVEENIEIEKEVVQNTEQHNLQETSKPQELDKEKI